MILQRMKFFSAVKKLFYYLKKGVGVSLMSLSKVDLPKKTPKEKQNKVTCNLQVYNLYGIQYM